MSLIVSNDLLRKWLHGWALSRELPPPSVYKSGLRLEVGTATQKSRYVFAEANDDFLHLAETIREPWVYLKVCAANTDIESKIPPRWQIQPQRYLMSCLQRFGGSQVPLPDAYKLELDTYNSTSHIRILSRDGTPASSGRVVIVEDIAVYDRIETDSNHRRKGLATYVMQELEKIAVANNVYKNYLVATEEGKRLYESLGWSVCSLYASMVILE
ncbi:MAG TPA: GNAT family N-acetyltransferase [Flavobacterium sp.]|jgi:GNAT superfamily N-acetyltransferase